MLGLCGVPDACIDDITAFLEDALHAGSIPQRHITVNRRKDTDLNEMYVRNQEESESFTTYPIPKDKACHASRPNRILKRRCAMTSRRAGVCRVGGSRGTSALADPENHDIDTDCPLCCLQGKWFRDNINAYIVVKRK